MSREDALEVARLIRKWATRNGLLSDHERKNLLTVAQWIYESISEAESLIGDVHAALGVNQGSPVED